MVMGTRRQREKQEEMWVARAELASTPTHPFYQRLKELLEANQFDEFVEPLDVAPYPFPVKAIFPAACFSGQFCELPENAAFWTRE